MPAGRVTAQFADTNPNAADELGGGLLLASGRVWWCCGILTLPGSSRREGSPFLVAADNVTHLPSKQQEQQPQTAASRAPQEEVDSYVDRVTDEVVACRQRGRHLWPAMRVQDQPFSAVDEHGLFVRRLTCTCCELAVRVEKWEATGRGRRARLQLVAAHLEYITGSEGQTYLAPSGRGRMTPRQVADSVASKALQGQSLAALRKSLPRV